MSITVTVSPETQARLMEKATAAGVDLETYTARQLELLVSSRPSLKELSGPIAQHFAESGMTEDELSQFLEDEKHAMRAERAARQSR